MFNINLIDTDKREEQNCKLNVQTFCQVRDSPLLIFPKWSTLLPSFLISKSEICGNLDTLKIFSYISGN